MKSQRHKPTDKAIQEEVARLKKMKPRVLHRSFFGDDHHAAIDAQVRVLENNMSADSIENYFEPDEDGRGQNILDAALSACYWREGEIDENPSHEWKELIR